MDMQMLSHRYQAQGSKHKTVEAQLHGYNNSNVGAVSRFESNRASSHLFGELNQLFSRHFSSPPSILCLMFQIRRLHFILETLKKLKL